MKIIFCDKCQKSINDDCWKLRIQKAADKPIKTHLCNTCVDVVLKYFVDDPEASNDQENKKKSEFIPVVPKGRITKRRNAERIMAMRVFGFSNEQIAREIEANKNVVAMAVHNFKKNLDEKEIGLMEGIDTAKVSALHAAGWDDNKIADEMSVTEKFIREILYVQEKYGVHK